MKKIFSWIITLVTVSILFWICSLFIESRQAIHWPTTKGVVVSSSLVINHLPKFIDFSADPMRWYGTEVQYEYTVGDMDYTSHRVAIQDNTDQSAKSALKVMNKYRKIHDVIVYYNPNNPQQAVLEPGNVGDIILPLMVAGMFLFIWMFTFPGQTIQFKPPDSSDFLRWGNIYQKQGRFDDALVEFNKIIEFNPSLAQGYKSRGGLYLQLHKWDDAIADFKQAITIDPIDGKVFYERSVAYLAKDQYEKAWEDVQKALENGYKVNPDFLVKVTNGLNPQ